MVSLTDLFSQLAVQFGMESKDSGILLQYVFLSHEAVFNPARTEVVQLLDACGSFLFVIEISHAHTYQNNQGERRIGALTAIKARAPVLGGNFGVWGGLFSTFDCAVKGVRQKEDPYNASMYRLPVDVSTD